MKIDVALTHLAPEDFICEQMMKLGIVIFPYEPLCIYNNILSYLSSSQ